MKNYTFRYLFVIALATFCFQTSDVQAQGPDPRFSQMNAGPTQLNPALIGVFEGQFRVAFNYRDQYRAIFQDVPYKTVGASFDMKFNALKRDFFSVGLTMLSDKAGDSQFSQSQTSLGMSYMKHIAGGRGRKDVQYLIAGAQIGIGQTGINWNSLRWSTQFDGNGFDGSLPTGEQFGASSNVYMDLNAGLMWYALLGNNRSVYAGASMHHINSPEISLFEDQSENLYSRYTLHAGGEIRVGRDVSLLPGARFLYQGPSLETQVGTSLRFTNRDFGDVALRAGAYGRLVNANSGISSDAVVVLAALEWESWTLGLSYDVSISSINDLNDGRGAFELSLMYVHPSRRRGGLYCPTF